MITCPRLLTLLASPNTVSVTLLLYLRLPSRAMGNGTHSTARSLHTFVPPEGREKGALHCIGEEGHRGTVVVLICGVLLRHWPICICHTPQQHLLPIQR